MYCSVEISRETCTVELEIQVSRTFKRKDKKEPNNWQTMAEGHSTAPGSQLIRSAETQARDRRWSRGEESTVDFTASGR